MVLVGHPGTGREVSRAVVSASEAQPMAVSGRAERTESRYPSAAAAAAGSPDRAERVADLADADQEAARQEASVKKSHHSEGARPQSDRETDAARRLRPAAVRGADLRRRSGSLHRGTYPHPARRRRSGDLLHDRRARRHLPGLARQVGAAGFEIGNHSYSHPDLTRLSAAEVDDQLARTNLAILRATGHRPTLLRPPYGARDRRLDRIAARSGLGEVLWDVDTLDWKHHDAKAVRRVVRRDVRRGSIVLLHDIQPTTVQAVPKLIAQLRRAALHAGHGQ